MCLSMRKTISVFFYPTWSFVTLANNKLKISQIYPRPNLKTSAPVLKMSVKKQNNNTCYERSSEHRYLMYRLCNEAISEDAANYSPWILVLSFQFSASTIYWNYQYEKKTGFFDGDGVEKERSTFHLDSAVNWGSAAAWAIKLPQSMKQWTAAWGWAGRGLEQ